MTTLQQVSVFAQDGSRSGSLALPGVFAAPIRTDVVHSVHTSMSKNRRQAYAVKDSAGHQHSAESWGTGRAVSRIPRVSGSGNGRSGQAAFGNMCRKGRMFAPTKQWRHWNRRISKNERRYATSAALSASAIPALVEARGHKIDSTPQFPLVVAASVENISKTKEAVAVLNSLGANDDVDRCAGSRQVRSGKGKWRNRRHTQRRGPLVVYKNDNGLVNAFRNVPGVETCNVNALNLLQLAPGGHVGRFVIWTESAFAHLDGLFGSADKPADASLKKRRNGDYILPRHKMTNSDVARLINSDEIQSVLRPQVKATSARKTTKKNPLKNLQALVKLNPYAKSFKRNEYLFAESRRKANAAKKAAKKN
jgi:large subunit ribosomal protein L4e